MNLGGRWKDIHTPQMKPGGNPGADVYVLAEAPGMDEDALGCPMVGLSGQYMREALYQVLGGHSVVEADPSWQQVCKYTNSLVRFNNVIRCHPKKNRDPHWEEVEACRNFIVEDIEQCRPNVILGMGNIPLRWMIGETGILSWRGKTIPVQVGTHACWYAQLELE